MQIDALDSLRPLCQNSPDYGPGYGPYGGFHMMSPLGGGLLMALFLAAVFIVLTRVARRNTGQPESALDILKKRYAKGEISQEEFQRMRQELKD